MLKEFKEFALRGNVLDMAIGIIIGAAFGKIVTSLVTDIIMPPFGVILGKVDFSEIGWILPGQVHYNTLAEAKKAGAAVVGVGTFLNTVIDFLIVAFVVFLLVRQVNRLMKPKTAAPEVPSTKECPYCVSTISIRATRCPQCTAELKASA